MEAPSRSSRSRKHRVQLTFLWPLPILQLCWLEVFLPRWVRGEGAPAGGSQNGSRSVLGCWRVSRPTGPGPWDHVSAPSPGSTPSPRWKPPAGLFLACPYPSGPRDSPPDVCSRGGSDSSGSRRGHHAAWRRGWEWPLSHRDTSTSLQAGQSPPPGEVLALKAGAGWGGHTGDGLGASGCYSVQTRSWSDTFFCPQNFFGRLAEWGPAEHTAEGRVPLNPGNLSSVGMRTVTHVSWVSWESSVYLCK